MQMMAAVSQCPALVPSIKSKSLAFAFRQMVDVLFDAVVKTTLMQGSSIAMSCIFKMLREWRPCTLRFGCHLASALHYCHRNNVLHVVVKPSSVLVHNGDCKLAYFRSSATRSSQPKVCSTVQYMAPEVLLGQQPEFSADVYSLGVVLWQMQFGVRPFDGLHQHAVMFQVSHQTAVGGHSSQHQA
ncbi:serine/threonine-protein kinase mos-like isoform X1 [Dermacentor albipictus]|uniref:serine/threonine-protein kinase mos-like isoform X1 n=1 Tax=Dermacentor albipictus TaxID=60249 RepID=UPI0038FC6DDB